MLDWFNCFRRQVNEKRPLSIFIVAPHLWWFLGHGQFIGRAQPRIGNLPLFRLLGCRLRSSHGQRNHALWGLDCSEVVSRGYYTDLTIFWPNPNGDPQWLRFIYTVSFINLSFYKQKHITRFSSKEPNQDTNRKGLNSNIQTWGPCNRSKNQLFQVWHPSLRCLRIGFRLLPVIS